MKKKMKVLISAILIGVLMFGGCAPAKDAKNETTNTKKEKTEKKAELEVKPTIIKSTKQVKKQVAKTEVINYVVKRLQGAG